MNQHFAIGQKLTLHLFNYSPEEFVAGQFHSFNQEKTRISLTNVVLHPSMMQMPNLMHYYFSEIKHVEAERIVEPLPAYINYDVGRSLAYCKGPSHPHLSYLYNQPERGQPAADRKQRPDYEVLKKKYECFKIIDRQDEQFDEAISVIKTSSVIGVSFEGVLLGRFGELCWGNFSDGENTFLFDVKAIGLPECLVNILLDKDVTKVVHDIRMPADCLLNKHKISMVNVIDTQVFDLMIMRSERENCPSYAPSLADCLRRYLKVSDSVLLKPVIWEEKIKDETAKWAVRPLPEFDLEVAVQNVAFLTDLYSQMKTSYFQPVKLGSEFYLNHLSSMNNEDAQKYNSMNHLTPRQLYWICRNRENSKQK